MINSVINPREIRETMKVGEMETIGVIKYGMDAIIFSDAAFRTVDGKSSLAMLSCLEGLFWMHVLGIVQKSPQQRKPK